MNIKKVSVLGLGKLGACYAAFYASRGYTVLGLDIVEKTVQLINQGKAPVQEPGLQEMISGCSGRLSATTDIARLMSETDITFLILPTPSQKNGLFSLRYVISVAKAIGPHLRKKKDYHTFVLVSTVLPGDSRAQIIPVLEKVSGKKAGVDFGYVYSPSLIAIGDILKNLTHPDFLFLGALDKRCQDIVACVYTDIYKGEKTPHPTSIESAELAKISLNSYVTMKITFANILGSLCEGTPFADVDEITDAIGADRRIGKVCLKSGLGYGGPCFPRDNFAFAGMAKKLGIKTPLALVTHRLNNEVSQTHLRQLAKVSVDKRVGILGVAYKPNTTLTEESQALFIVRELIRLGHRVSVYEPVGLVDAKDALQDTVTYIGSLPRLVKESDVVFISNPDPLFKDLSEILKRETATKIIVDPWGLFNKGDFPATVTYISLGRKVRTS